MKLAGTILAFYLLLLAAIPCCSFDDCPDEATELAGSHPEQDEDCGNCSPFFSCEGCFAASIAYEPATLGITAFTTPAAFTGYIQTSLPRLNYDFWQPPRLV